MGPRLVHTFLVLASVCYLVHATGQIRNERNETESSDRQEITDTDGGWLACDGTDAEACHCEQEEINCDNVIFKDELPLNTADMDISNKSFHVIRATFQTGTFSSFRNLSKLYLSNNKIKQLKRDHFYGLTGLHQLFLDSNKIANLEDGVFEHLPNLRKLVLDGNKIRLRAEIFDGLNSLEELSLDYCGIDNLNVNAFESLPNLKKLSLRGNPFSEVPRALNALDKLEDLDISGTNIAEFHAQSLKDDHILKQLYMCDMPFLYAIQDCAFCGLERLELVHMNNCSRLHEIHPNAFGWSDRSEGKVGNLKHLYAENCNIRTINENLLPWDTLEELGIGGNPINCSCETAFLLEDEYFSYEYTNTLPKCALPPELKGRLLTRVAQSDACAAKLTAEMGSRFTGIFMMMLLLVFGTIGIYLCVITKRCEKLIRNIQDPKVSYSNLANKDDQQGLEQDFQPRPQEV
ncbi:hypothetical protein Angca_002613 [Angiostrongylus cantonensis]|nr:hypothetical protein Angca_002613 [Angiostrongylus cantonensis]